MLKLALTASTMVEASCRLEVLMSKNSVDALNLALTASTDVMEAVSAKFRAKTVKAPHRLDVRDFSERTIDGANIRLIDSKA